MNTSKYFHGSYILIAATILLEGCSIAETPTNTLLRKARDFEFSEQFAQAEATYDQAYNLNREPGRIQLLILLDEARLFLRTKNYNKAILTSQKGLKVCQSLFGANDMLNTSFLFVLGSAYDNSKEYDKAKLLYNRIIAFAPHSHCSEDLVVLIPLIKLGDIEFKKNNLPQAYELYKKAYAIGELAEIMHMLTSYRLALCCIAMHRKDEADFYFKQALPHRYFNSAPKDIYLRYGKFLTKAGKFGSAALTVNESAEWYAKHKAYLDWYYPRTGPGSRRRFLDRYTEEDYNLVDAIQQNSKM